MTIESIAILVIPLILLIPGLWFLARMTDRLMERDKRLTQGWVERQGGAVITVSLGYTLRSFFTRTWECQVVWADKAGKRHSTRLTFAIWGGNPIWRTDEEEKTAPSQQIQPIAGKPGSG